MSKRRVVETYRESYRKGTFVEPHRVSSCAPGAIPPLAAGAVIKEIEVKAAGHATVDGERLEFIDVRLYVLP